MSGHETNVHSLAGPCAWLGACIVLAILLSTVRRQCGGKNMASLTAENNSLTSATRFSVYTPLASRPSVVYSREGESDVYPVFLVEAPFLYNFPVL